MTAVWAVTTLIHTDKLVLLALADNANDEGLCWPSVATLTQKCGMDTRTVQRVVGRLCEAGHLSVHERQGKSNYYTVHPWRSDTPGVAPSRHKDAPADDRSGANATSPGAAPPSPPAQRHHPPGAAPPIIIIEPSVESPKNRHVAKNATHLPEDFSLTEDRRSVATTERVDPDREFANFRDHWSAASGARARKRNWDAAWRIWCRKGADMLADRSAGRRPNGPAPTDERRALERLKERRHAIGLSNFRDPHPSETAESYGKAQDAEFKRLDQQKNGAPRFAQALVVAKTLVPA